MTDRIVIVGGPRTGKSTLAGMLSKNRHPHAGTTLLVERHPPAPVFCCDPLSTVKDPIQGVNYLPEGLPFAGDGGAADWIARNWMQMPGPYIIEGHATARALRRWLQVESEDLRCDVASTYIDWFPCEKIIVFESQRHDCDLKRGQVAMQAGVLRVWSGIADYFEPIVEYR